MQLVDQVIGAEAHDALHSLTLENVPQGSGQAATTQKADRNQLPHSIAAQRTYHTFS